MKYDVFLKGKTVDLVNVDRKLILKKANKLIGMVSLYNINHFDSCCNISALFNMNEKKIG